MEDARIAKSRKALLDAMVRLVDIIPFSKITVKELCYFSILRGFEGFMGRFTSVYDAGPERDYMASFVAGGMYAAMRHWCLFDESTSIEEYTRCITLLVSPIVAAKGKTPLVARE